MPTLRLYALLLARPLPDVLSLLSTSVDRGTVAAIAGAVSLYVSAACARRRSAHCMSFAGFHKGKSAPDKRSFIKLEKPIESTIN